MDSLQPVPVTNCSRSCNVPCPREKHQRIVWTQRCFSFWGERWPTGYFANSLFWGEGESCWRTTGKIPFYSPTYQPFPTDIFEGKILLRPLFWLPKLNYLQCWLATVDNYNLFRHVKSGWPHWTLPNSAQTSDLQNEKSTLIVDIIQTFRLLSGGQYEHLIITALSLTGGVN